MIDVTSIDMRYMEYTSVRGTPLGSNKLMLFYPIFYHNVVEGRYSTIAVVAYGENDEKVLVKIRYPYSFFVSGVSHDEAYSCVANLGGVYLCDEHDRGRSTRNPSDLIDAIRIDCDNQDARNEAIRLFQNRDVRVHEINNALTPLLKMLQQRDVSYYSWMDIEAEEAMGDPLSIGRKEYVGDVLTLKKYEKDLPPPATSIFSIDLECNSVDWDVMCDASSHMDNDIKMACITYVYKDTYKEYAICYGPNIAEMWKKFNDEDVRVITAKSELHLIQLIFACIQKFDPDFIVGHNIAGFDVPYIITRYKLLCMRARIPVEIPNISRFNSTVVKPFSIEWNNNQVSMSGKLLYVPGRIWIDTLILAARNFFGQMENNKLDTLAKVILGMSKNDVSHKDMFAWFALWNRWNGGERGEEISEAIKRQYEIGFKKYNKKLPPLQDIATVDDINNLVIMINVMNQRGKRRAVYTKNEGMKLDRKKVYTELRVECQSFIDKWNMPWIAEEEEERIKALWWVVARYCVHDTRIPYRVISLQNMIPVLMEQSNIFCVSINEILCRGQIHAVTSSQYRKARALNYLVDLVEKGDPSKLGRKPGGGYVGKGAPGMKIKDNDSVMLVFDFKSLYPTIIIAKNICYTTWVPYEKRDKEVTRDMCNIIVVDDVVDKETGELYPPVEHWFLKKEILPGIVPSMLWDQYKSRDSIKARMKIAEIIMKVVYGAQEKAVKVGMNSAYGAFGTEHSYICNKACADATTCVGRKSIQKVNGLLEEKGHSVAYNDTDSAMVVISGIKEKFNCEVEKIKQFGADLSAELSSYFPDPMQLEMENIFLSFLLLGPKMYMAIKCDGNSTDLLSYGMTYIEANNLLYSKGVASVRRDKYALYKEIHRKIQELILLKHSGEIVEAVLHKFITAIWRLKDSYKNREKLEEKMSYNMGISPKAVSGGGGTMGQWVSRYEQHYRRKPLKGERFKLLVCEGNDPHKHTKSADKLHTSDWMEKANKKLDIIHYLNCFESKGGVIELINIAYGHPIPKNAMRDYYIPMLITHGTLDVKDEEVSWRPKY